MHWNPLFAARGVLQVSVVAVVSLCTLAAHAETLVVFGGDGFAPTTYVHEGKPAGRLVDILTKASEMTGDRYQIRLYPWKRAYESALRGEGAIMGVSMTTQRQELFDFSEPLYHNDLQLVVRKGREFPFTKLADLQGKTLGGGLGVSYGDAVDAAVQSGEMQLERDSDASVRLFKVLNGSLDAAIIGHGMPGLEAVITGQHRLLGRRDELAVLAHPLVRDPLYFAVAKGSHKTELIERLNKALREVR